jgi:hypothetical protein
MYFDGIFRYFKKTIVSILRHPNVYSLYSNKNHWPLNDM